MIQKYPPEGKRTRWRERSALDAGLLAAALAGLLPALLAACAPTLYRPTRTDHYRAKALCSQGPLELSLEAAGGSWGETVRLAALGPRDLGGFYEVYADGKLLRRGSWGQTKEVWTRSSAPPQTVSASAGTGAPAPSASGQAAPAPRPTFTKTGARAVTGPDNRRCLASAPGAGAVPGAEQAPVSAGSGGKAATSGGSSGAGRGRVKGTAAERPAPAEDARAADSGLEKADLEAQQAKWPDTVYRFPIGEAFGTRHGSSSCYSKHLGPRNTLGRGAKVVIRLWSSQPNDLEDVIFTLEHERTFASEGWEKRQKKRFRTCLAKHPAQKRRWEAVERERRRRDSLAARRGKGHHTSECVQYHPAPLADPEGRPYKASVTRPCFCFKVPSDETCWGKGGLEGFGKRLVASPPTEGYCYADRGASRWGFTKRMLISRPCHCFRKLGDEGCWGKGGYDAFERSRLDKIFSEPCVRDVWIDTRVPVTGPTWGRARGQVRPPRPAPPPRPASADPPLPERYLHELARPCTCYAKPKDVACWGPGGYEGLLGRLRKALPSEGSCTVHHQTRHPTRPGVTWLLPVKKPCACFGRPSDETCWGRGGQQAHLREVEARYTRIILAQESGARPGAGGLTKGEPDDQQIEAGRRALQLQREQAEAERRYRELHARETAARPDRPAPRSGAEAKLPPKPPSPRKESPPERPSKNAAWVPGYWHRGGDKWHWIGGWWRVPPTDVSEGLTAKADRSPPALRRERPLTAPPVPEAVWMSGYWHWHAGRFIWIEGRWSIPPKRGQHWRPSIWRKVPGGAVFSPGNWVAPKR